MNLIAEVKQKNEQLLLQGEELQRHLCASVNAPEFRSFAITFTVAPFIVGAMAGIFFAPKGSVSHRLCRIAFPGLRLWPFF